MIVTFIFIIVFVWIILCAAKMIAKEIICKDCILKRECDKHRNQTGKTFCENKELNNYFNNYFHYPFV